MKNAPLDLIEINRKLTNYTYSNYDLHFVHGWFCAYLSAVIESEDDLVIPNYLIIDENKILDEQDFTHTIDELIKVYTMLASNLFEQNRSIKPLIDLNNPQISEPGSETEKRNLLNWIYGYLSGYLTLGEENVAYEDATFLADKFFPALFTLCVAMYHLVQELDLSYIADTMREDFEELLADTKSMWEETDNEARIDEQINQAIQAFKYSDVVLALNDIFQVVRILDEQRYAANNLTTNSIDSTITIH